MTTDKTYTTRIIITLRSLLLFCLQVADRPFFVIHNNNNNIGRISGCARVRTRRIVSVVITIHRHCLLLQKRRGRDVRPAHPSRLRHLRRRLL